MKFREILSHLISQWALTSQFCYGSGLVVAERSASAGRSALWVLVKEKL